MADRGAQPHPQLPDLPDNTGAVFLGDSQFDGDAVAGNKIIYVASEAHQTPAQLPADVHDFTGRQASLDRLNELTSLDGPRTALLTAIHGMAGVGKTALAVHWGHRVAKEFPDGQLYVDLRGYSDDVALTPIEALGRFLRALGVPDQRVPEDEDERAALFRSMLSGRRMLVILDNAANPQQVRPLLPGSSTCLTLVTSRSQLSALVAGGGAYTIAIDVLSAVESVDLIATIVDPDRVMGEPEAAAQLAQQCAYLPLALRIAAAHVAMGTYASISELVEELAGGDRLGALECDDDPHLAIRAAFDLSYRHLDEPVQRAFRLIGLLEGPDFTAQILAVLLGASVEETRPLLRVLVHANLVQPRARGRFRLHDLLREYARERVTEEEALEARTSAIAGLFSWYIANADAYGRCLDPYRSRLTTGTANGDYADALAWFEAERMGLVAAARQAARLKMGAPVWELADAAFDFLRLRRYDRDNARMQRLALSAARAAGATHPEAAMARAYVLHHLAALHRDLGGYAEALQFARRALQACREAGRDSTHALHTLHLVANIHWRMGKYARALDCLAEDLRSCQELGDRPGEANTLTSMGLVYRNLGRYSDAIEHLERAVRTERETGNRRGEGGVLQLLASVHRSMGLSRKAAEYAQLALEAQHDSGDRAGQASAFNLLTMVSRSLGEHDQAVRHGEQSLEIRREIGDRLGEGQALDTLSMLRRQLGDYRRAEELATESLKVRREIGDRPGEAQAMETLAKALSYTGRPQEALDTELRALQIRREIGDRTGEARALALLARIAVYVDRLQDGLRYAEESLAIRREVGDRRGEGDSLQNIARMYRKLDRPADAIVYARQSLELRREIGDRRGEGEALDNISRVHLKMGNAEEAMSFARQALVVEREIDDLFGLGWTLDHLAEIHLNLGEGERAVRLCEQALRVREQIHDRHGQRRTLEHLTLIHRELGRPDQALDAALRALEILRGYREPHTLAPRLREIARLVEQTQGPEAARTYWQQAGDTVNG